MNRVLSVAQARSLYLKSVAEAKRQETSQDRSQALQVVKSAEKTLQRAQMQARLRKSQGRIARPTDWNEELS